ALAQPFARNGAGHHAHRGLARRGPSAAAVVADAVFLPVAVVGVAGPEGLGDGRVVLGARILVADDEADGRARGPALENARQQFHRIRLAPLGDVPRGAGLAPVEVALDVGLGQCHARRAAVHHAPERRAVRFAERSHAIQRAETVAGHRIPCVLLLYRRSAGAYSSSFSGQSLI